MAMPKPLHIWLSSISAIGKKRSQGYGLVEKWEIRPVDTFSFLDEIGKPLCSIPTACFDRLSAHRCRIHQLDTTLLVLSIDAAVSYAGFIRKGNCYGTYKTCRIL